MNTGRYIFSRFLLRCTPYFLLLSLVIWSLGIGYAATKKQNAPSHQDLQRQLDALQDQVDMMDEKTGGGTLLKGFEAKKFHLGGFLNTTATALVDKDGRGAGSFNLQQFELLLRANLTDNWSAFVAWAAVWEANLKYREANHSQPYFTPYALKVPLVIGWTNYRVADWLNVRIGRIITPLGIINIEHFPAALLDTEQPQFLRPFGGQTMFPNFSNGIELLGKLYQKDGDLAYYAYVTNYVMNANRPIEGVRLAYTYNPFGATVGVNFNHGERTDTHGLAPTSTNTGYELYGADLRIEKSWFLFKSEVFYSDEHAGRNRLAWYLQPAVVLSPKWIVFYRHDYLRGGADNYTAATILNTGNSQEEVLGVNLLPIPNIRLRTTMTYAHYTAGSGVNVSGDKKIITPINFGSGHDWIARFEATWSF